MRHVPLPLDLDPAPVAIRAGDGYSLGATVYPPARRPVGTVLVHGATAVPQRYYAGFAGYLAARGLRVVTYDYRGVGASRPWRLAGFPARRTAWVHDRYDDRPLAVVGHSFGGQLLGLVDDVRDAAGALLVGAQLGAVQHAPPLRRAAYRAFFRAVVPAAAWATGYVPGWAGLGEDLPAGVAREWARWCLHPDYLLVDHPDARARFAGFRRPVLLYSFDDDGFAPGPSVDALAEALTGADLEHRRQRRDEVGAVGHFGFFRPAMEKRFWGDAAAWLLALVRGEPLPKDVLLTESEVARDLGYGR